MKIDVKVTRSGKKLEPEILQHNLLIALVERAEKVQKDFEKTTATWHTQAAEFSITTPEANAKEVATNSEIYRFLNSGTSVRYATMSKDFVSKTRPNWIGSGGGAGKKLFVNRKKPKPGIKARNFDKAIAKKHEPLLKIDLEKVLNKV